MMSKWHGRTFEAAEQYLAGGRVKHYRPVCNNTYLSRVDDDTIALVFHWTTVVAYHRDGTQTLYTGGFSTVTTKARINEFSAARVRSTYSQKYKGWTLGGVEGYTPSRVQKCRTCKGAGGWVQRKTCYGARSWDGTTRVVCEGPRAKHAIPYSSDNFAAYSASRYIVPCEHGPAFEKSHLLTLCEHGQRRGQHEYGDVYASECHRCHGAGEVEYGNQPIPEIWDGQPVRVDANGTVIEWHAHGVTAPGKVYAPKKYTSTPSFSPPPAPKPHKMGSEVKHRLEVAVPGLKTVVKCPACTSTEQCGDQTVSDMIIHLNDSKGWSRQRIADWLDTLDADLRFPIPERITDGSK